MTESEFFREEYRSLRDEIKETKARLFKLAGLALLGLPSVSALIERLQVDVLAVVLPGVIVATMLLYLSESSALMRCGTYIKKEIEGSVWPENERKPEDTQGWEHWLATDSTDSDDRRRVDKMAFWFFMSVFIIYYLAAALLGFQRSTALGTHGPDVALSLYILVGGIFLWSIRRHYVVATQTS